MLLRHNPTGTSKIPLQSTPFDEKVITFTSIVTLDILESWTEELLNKTQAHKIMIMMGEQKCLFELSSS